MKCKGIIKNKEEYIKTLIAIGVTGIDKPWEKMSMSEKTRRVRHFDHKRVKEVNVAKITRAGERADFIMDFPKAADRYDINRFDNNNLSRIVRVVPSLLKRVRNNRIPKLDWYFILMRQPQLARYCDFASFSAVEWACLLREQPQFADRLDPARFTSVIDWSELLRGDPSLWRKCPFASFTREDQIRCAAVSLPLLKKLGLATLNGREWLELLRWADFLDSKVGKWLARELKRLSGRLNLPR